MAVGFSCAASLANLCAATRVRENKWRRAAAAWVKVNAGVLLCAALAHGCASLTLLSTGSRVAAASVATAALYVLVYTACSVNLRGRRRALQTTKPVITPIAFASIIGHPIGSCVERLVHERYLAPAASAAFYSAAQWPPPLLSLAVSGGCWWFALALRLLFFEVIFDGLFYVAHRLVHAHPLLYQYVHKLHHKHTHELRLLSSLQMTPLDVLLTHTLPVLGALYLVPIEAGIELSIAKTYLLFQEFYGHAGVVHKGRNFGPAPWLAYALDIELRAQDHQRHHIKAGCNFSKRFSLFDRLFGTWDGGTGAGEGAEAEHVHDD